MRSYWEKYLDKPRIIGYKRGFRPVYSISGGAAAPMIQTMPNPDVQPRTSQQAVPFRRATIERTNILQQLSGPLTASLQPIDSVIEGSGYLYSVVLLATATANNNNAVVAFAEDAPYNFYDSVVLRDVNGEQQNLQGYDIYLSNLINREFAVSPPQGAADSNFWTTPVTGGGGTAGSFAFPIRISAGVNRRDLVGILGNQDRAQKYFLRTNIAATGAIYTTPPNGTGVTFAVSPFYENYSVPLPTSALNQPQEIYPPSFGTLHYITNTISDASPQPGVVNHYIRRLGNTVRWFCLSFRSNGSRVTAEANAPTNIQFRIGENTVFNETYPYRRMLMFERFGFVFPPGVLVYDALHDFAAAAGFEMGDDYYHTQAVQTAQFQITYPNGFGSTNNSLRIMTDDLQRIGAPSR